MRSSDDPNQTKSGGAAHQQDQSRKPQDQPEQTKPGNQRKDEPIQQYLYKQRRPKQVQG